MDSGLPMVVVAAAKAVESLLANWDDVIRQWKESKS